MPAQTIIPAKFSVTIEGQNNIFHDKTRFNQYLATNPALHKVLEGKLQPKEVGYINKTQTIEDLTAANPKERKNTQNNITNNEN